MGWNKDQIQGFEEEFEKVAIRGLGLLRKLPVKRLKLVVLPATEVAGLGILGTPSAAGLKSRKAKSTKQGKARKYFTSPQGGHVTELAGLGILTIPSIVEIVKELSHKPSLVKRIFGRLVVLFLASNLLLSQVSAAAPVLEIELFRIPEGTPKLFGGDKLMCYTFEEWKTILKVDQDLKSALYKHGGYEGIITVYEKKERAWEKKEKSYEESITNKDEEIAGLVTEKIDLSKKLKKANSKGLFTSLSFAASGTLAIIAVITLFVQ